MKTSKECYWVYILVCENDTYYTGYTNNLAKRYHSHLDGTGGCKYTKSFKPICIAQCWKINADKAFAMQVERDIKKLTRTEKDLLIAKPSSVSKDKRIKTVSQKQIAKIQDIYMDK